MGYQGYVLNFVFNALILDLVLQYYDIRGVPFVVLHER